MYAPRLLLHIRGHPTKSYPADSKFTQQELPAFKPLLTPSWVSVHPNIENLLMTAAALYASVLAGDSCIFHHRCCLHSDWSCLPCSICGGELLFAITSLLAVSTVQHNDAAAAQVVEVSSRYDDTCITGNTNAARDAALTQVSLMSQAAQCQLVLCFRMQICIKSGMRCVVVRGSWNLMQCNPQGAKAHEASHICVLPAEQLLPEPQEVWRCLPP